EQRSVNPEEPPIPVLFVDTRSPIDQPTNHILLGRQHLTDYRAEASCALKEEGTFYCDEKEFSPAVLHPLLRWQREPAFRLAWDVVKKEERLRYEARVSEKEQRAALNNARRRTAEFYVLPEDVPYFWEDASEAGRYAAGAIPFSNGLSDSPFVWARLNW
ncbi:MAG: hypothetical protein KDD44_03200, partial [Bdellovibrionales bacterium]|nr:hypothetical protein [Bdellovibrionales bacterium]